MSGFASRRWRWITIAILVAGALAVLLTQVQVGRAAVCPTSGAGFCTDARLEPLWQWIVDLVRSMV
jgi:hypothetical protein